MVYRLRHQLIDQGVTGSIPGLSIYLFVLWISKFKKFHQKFKKAPHYLLQFISNVYTFIKTCCVFIEKIGEIHLGLMHLKQKMTGFHQILMNMYQILMTLHKALMEIIQLFSLLHHILYSLKHSFSHQFKSKNVVHLTWKILSFGKSVIGKEFDGILMAVQVCYCFWWWWFSVPSAWILLGLLKHTFEK